MPRQPSHLRHQKRFGFQMNWLTVLFAHYYFPTTINEPDSLQEMGFKMKVSQICKCNFCLTGAFPGTCTFVVRGICWLHRYCWRNTPAGTGKGIGTGNVSVCFIEWWWVGLCVSVQGWIGSGVEQQMQQCESAQNPLSLQMPPEVFLWRYCPAVTENRPLFKLIFSVYLCI